jgi:antitoxin VapB
MGTPQLNIKDAEANRLVRELTELTGETQTEAIRKSVRQRLEHERRLRQRTAVRSEDNEIADLRAFLARCREEMKPYSAADNDYMYDEFGAPI